MARRLFFRTVLKKFSKITNSQPVFTQYNTFYNYEYFFFNLHFDLFLIIAKEVNQIRNNVVCVVLRFVVSPCINLYFFCAYLLYLPVINFTPIIGVLVIETQSWVKLICSFSRKNVFD